MCSRSGERKTKHNMNVKGGLVTPASHFQREEEAEPVAGII